MKNTPPSAQTFVDVKPKKTYKVIISKVLSAQTEWERDFDSRFDYSIIDSVIRDMGDDATWLTMKKNIKLFIRNLLASERTRLLSVESMKEVHSRAMCNPRNKVGCVCEHKQENALRQSILSEVEKGSV